MTAPDDSELTIAADLSENDAAWHLRLYVAGELPKSANALENLRNICEEHLAGHYDIEVVDLVLQPTLARRDDIVAVPTLVRRLPKPLLKIIGDLSNTDRVLHHLLLADAIVATPAPGTPRTRSRDPVVDHDRCQYELALVVGGAPEFSASAIANARRLCDDHMGDSYHLTVVDLHEDPASVVDNAVMVTPTLIKQWPLPVRKFVGDLSKPDEVVTALGLP